MGILGNILKPFVEVANVATLGLAKPLLETAAPIIGGALGAAGGPLGTAVGSAIGSTVANEVLSGGGDDSSPV
jgi:phage tail tape-measure protein